LQESLVREPRGRFRVDPVAPSLGVVLDLDQELVLALVPNISVVWASQLMHVNFVSSYRR